ncbi:MAG TPA: tetratricopeptide repeat protein [Thermoanaerobaculia bacterium]|nr:tetratricopeptide repeat protein [Thermoanaerobaculia bacterium]
MTKTKRRSAVLLLLLLALPAALAAQRSTADAEVAFTYGVRAYNQGDWSEAVRRFEEAVAADPDHAEAREWLAVARRNQARTGEAVAAPGFGGLLALRDQPRFDLRAGASYGQDSNPLLMPEGAVASIPGVGAFFDVPDDEVANLDLRAAVYPFYGRAGWSLGLVGEAKAARFSDLDFLDETQWRGALQLAWGSDPQGFLTGPLGFSRVPFGHSRTALLFQVGTGETELDGDPLIQVDQAALSFTFRETVKTATQVEIDAQSRDLLDGQAESDVLSASVSQIFYLGRRDRSLRVGVLRSEEDGGIAGDVTTLGGTAELVLPLSKSLTLQLAATRRQDDFEPASGSGFEDTTLRAAGALTWSLPHGLYLVGRASWTDRDSDFRRLAFFEERDYDRTTAGLGIQWLF